MTKSAGQWVKQFLSCRNFSWQTDICDFGSEGFKSGVTPGSVLGPGLFPWRIIDLVKKLTNPWLIFEGPIKVVGQEILRGLEAAKKRSARWDPPANLDRC